MKVGITGIDHKLGSAIASRFSSTIGLNESLNGIDECDVFINNLVKGDLQQRLFDNVFNLWLSHPKTIVNILSSVVLDFGNPLGSYGETKINLHNHIKKTLNDFPNKQVRVVNIYPSTLSSNKAFDNFNKVDIQVVADIIKTALKLPQDIELRDISFYPTVRYKIFTTNNLL